MDQYKFIEMNGVKLFVMKSGVIYRFFNNKRWKLIENTNNHVDGYNKIGLNKKLFLRHRVMCYAYRKLDIMNYKLQIDHIDGDRLNNHIDNLRIVSHQQNQWNQTKAKGYYWNKRDKKWRAQINVNKKLLFLGSYTNEEDARQAYVNAKLIHHII